jgi:hypothetical protein
MLIQMRSSKFWDVNYRRFGTAYWCHVQGMETISGPETSITNYQSALRNIPEERKSHLQRGAGQESCLNLMFVLKKSVVINT